MSDRRKIEDFHDAYWIAGPRARSSAELPRGRALTPRQAVSQLDEWFAEGPGESARTELLYDICEQIGDVPGGGLEPPTLRALKARVADALASGYLVALRIKATTPAARRVETELVGEEKRAEQVTHWVEFVVTDQNNQPISGIDYVLTLVGAGPEKGTLGADGTVHKTGVKKGSHKLELKTITNARWEKDELKIGAAVKLLASVTGFPEHHAGKFHIYDATNLSGGSLVGPVVGQVKAGVGSALALEAVWTPKENELAAGKSGRLAFTAALDGLTPRATSAAARVLQKHEITVEDDDGAIANDVDVEARFSGGTRKTDKTADGKVSVWAPLGETLCWAQVKGRLGARATFKADGRESKYITPEHAKK